eukprot:TRINITY_DN2771_c0_g1_i1.p1 TRINITY_DN2771_c0_g1~~TRINITY_DN2771_c0_g1_i1.p1  ORF type:complete len:586 (-),score=228.08 TRINITY_DN2771_c0_g1_i1:356-2113(-)
MGKGQDKKGKKKLVEEGNAEQVEEVEEEVEEEEVKKEKKKDKKKEKKKEEPKKEKKDKKKEKPESEEEESEEEKEEKKKEKKKENEKKTPEKKNKRKQEEDQEEEEEIPQNKKTKKSLESSVITNTKTGKTFRKCFFEHSPEQEDFSEAEVAAFREKSGVTVTGERDHIFKPFRTFKESTFPKNLLTHCSKFEKPTPIQSQCWPIVLSGRDVIGISETGSGKTFSFLLPGVVHIQDQEPLNKNHQGPIALVLSPTRELAMQTADVCAEFQDIGIKSICIYGGVEKGPQKRAIREGVHVMIATPGRLIDLLNEGAVSLSRVTYLVLDEADRMLDLGFEPDIRTIIGQVCPERQTVMFSATWPQSVQALASDFQVSPVRINIGSMDLVACVNVKQIVEVVEPFQKEKKLLELLSKYHASRKNRILIFVLYKKEAVRVEENLNYKGWKALAIHGDMTQEKRTQALKSFKDGSFPLLVATDVAARGLDIRDVEYVINYTFPLTIEDYIHRIGRTGRAGKQGISHTFFTLHDKSRSGELINVLKDSNQEVPADIYKFGTATKKKEHKLYGAHFKETDENTLAKKSHIKFD